MTKLNITDNMISGVYLQMAHEAGTIDDDEFHDLREDVSVILTEQQLDAVKNFIDPNGYNIENSVHEIIEDAINRSTNVYDFEPPRNNMKLVR
ncbi:hypothetical protein ACKGJO_06855 [Gracilimonas sp. Q87]|uniref:hypothetical protein n=1 Tax=Gracilimonas sp. Q87 TaxID=3384766 RepID=UPI0039841A3E